MDLDSDPGHPSGLEAVVDMGSGLAYSDCSFAGLTANSSLLSPSPVSQLVLSCTCTPLHQL